MTFRAPSVVVGDLAEGENEARPKSEPSVVLKQVGWTMWNLSHYM